MSCIVCKSKPEKDNSESFYRIPERPKELQGKWITTLQKEGVKIDIEKLRSYRVCSAHFVNGAKGSKNVLDPNSTPSIFKLDEYKTKRTVLSVQRFNRLSYRKKKEEIKGTEENQLLFCPNCAGLNKIIKEQEQEIQKMKKLLGNSNVMSDLDPGFLESEIDESEDEECDENCLSAEETEFTNRELNFSFSFVYGNNEVVKYMTGLPNYAAFQWICTKFGDYALGIMDIQEQVLAFFFRIRLALPYRLLGILFNAHASTMQRNFTKWLDILYYGLKELVTFPSHENIIGSNPGEFRNYSKLVAILDCTEIFIQTPSSREARAKTFSHYKHHNTIKFLVACTPSGTIIGVSPAWGGLASDQKIVRESNILDKIQAGFEIMADRGFLIEDDCLVRGVSLIIPPFTRGKSQLSGAEVHLTTEIARLRIKVEQVIGSLKQTFHLLQTTIPISALRPCSNDNISQIDKIIVVCAALVNMRI